MKAVGTEARQARWLCYKISNKTCFFYYLVLATTRSANCLDLWLLTLDFSLFYCLCFPILIVAIRLDRAICDGLLASLHGTVRNNTTPTYERHFNSIFLSYGIYASPFFIFRSILLYLIVSTSRQYKQQQKGDSNKTIR